jgi:hypothetical protein
LELFVVVDVLVRDCWERKQRKANKHKQLWGMIMRGTRGAQNFKQPPFSEL